MAPVPQEHSSIEIDVPPSSDPNRVVISGMAGLFPDSNSVKELSETLYKRANPVISDKKRWKFNHPEVAPYTGQVANLNRFDAHFFSVTYRLGSYMDAMAKKMLEQAYQAIYDAGVNPEHLSGKKVGVYIGTAFSEMEKTLFYVATTTHGLGITGCSRTMFANRISYWLNAKGPSMAVDDACCSSTAALQQAYQAISRGECEAAIVGGGNLCLHPQSSVHFAKCMKLCMDGKTKSFDQNADGCAKSDVINILFLQKAKDALRIYADILHVKCEYTELLKDENGAPRYGFYRNPSTAANFLNSFYKEVQVPPQAVEYVEAFGCAVPEADKNELDALSQVFCKDRTGPLLVGSVMSNIGYTEAGSGISAVIKVLLGYHTGKLAGNLHYSTPHNDVDAIKEGKMRIVSEHTGFNRTYAAVNGLSVTGINAHVLLHGHYKPKDKNRYKSPIPQLVAVSGRQESAVEKVLDELKSLPVDPEQLHLFRHIHQSKIGGHLGRGYTILDTDMEGNTVCKCNALEYHDEAKRPLWFVYSGMGSQWAGMGTQLMRIPIFSAAIEKCHRVLEPKGVNIVEIITSPDKTMFDNILHSFVGIAAVQIGLTDILKALDIVPDGIIGHSVGELGCAYADGCFTAEEMILAAHSRGLVSVQTPFIKGSMAAVGIGYREVIKLCPPEVEVACHNGPDSCTISGPADIMKMFVTSLTEKEIFAKEVPCSNIAYHSRYIANAGPSLLKYLREVIKKPKLRSERWVSTSVPQECWQEDAARYSSPEYHTNNLLNPVLFEETSLLIPANAVCVEIAPHGLLQAILKRSLSSCQHIPLTKRGHSDNASMVLEGIGRLFMAGFYPKIQALYPKVELPVSTGTPMLSHLVEWSHTEKWNVTQYQSAERKMAAACKYIISTQDEEYTYLEGHIIREKVRYPFALALVSAWDTLLMSSGAGRVETVGCGVEGGVTFRDVRLHAAPTLHDQQAAKLTVQLHRGNKDFEIVDKHSLVATGFIFDELDNQTLQFNKEFIPHEELTLNSEAVYRILNERDYAYKGDFRSILSSNVSFTEAEIIWQDNWVTFIDGILQLHALRESYNGVSQPSSIRRLTIDLNEHSKRLKQVGDKMVATAQVFEQYGYTTCGGVIVEYIQFVNLPPLVEGKFLLKTLKFCPRFQTDDVDGLGGGEYYVDSSGYAQKECVVRLQSTANDLRSMSWNEVSALKEKGIPVQVHYASLNYLDAQRVSGVIPHDPDSELGGSHYAMDYSGITNSGVRVMGVVRGGAASTRVVGSQLTWPVPDHWSLLDAATVPLPYAHAVYCMGLKTKMQPGMSILVHGGTGALGQAVISIALAHDYDVFTTVSDMRKKKFLKKLFPKLQDDHIGNSRNQSFAELVLNLTKGNGVNLVISNSIGLLKSASLDCLSPFGIFIDTSQLKTQEEFNLGMNHLTNERGYFRVDFSTLFNDLNKEEMARVQYMVADGISRGYVRPLSRVVYPAEQAARAINLLQESRHRGRVVLDIIGSSVCCLNSCRDNSGHVDKDCIEKTINTGVEPLQNKIRRRLVCTPDLVQVVVIDDETLGLQVTDLLVARGATKLHLHVPNNSAYLNYKTYCWQKEGVEVNISTCKLQSAASAIDFVQISKNLGPVEGFYVVTKQKVNDVTNTYLVAVLDYLDEAARKLCLDVKNFAVVTEDCDIGEQVIQQRTSNYFPATSIQLHMLQQSLATHEALQGDAEGGEPHPSLLAQIATVAGMSIPADVDESATLLDLGIEVTKSAEVAAFLRYRHSVAIPENTIPSLTVHTLKKVEVSIYGPKFPEVRGLGTFFNYVDSDEMLATTDMVLLPTLTHGDNMRDDEFDYSQRYLCVVPGMEGHHERFRLICERLKLPAIVLQPGLDRLSEGLDGLAHRYAEVLLKKTQFKDKFYLLGYESGVIVALEMAAILEKQGLAGTVYCLGTGPKELKTVIQEETGFLEGDAFKDLVLKHMFNLMGGITTAELEQALTKTSTWNEKLNIYVRTLVGHISHSSQYAKSIFEAAYARIIETLNYTINPKKLKSKIVLIRAKDQGISNELQAYSEQPIEIYQLQMPLAHSAKDMRCSTIINKCLDLEIREEFKKKMLCMTYLVNPNTFMSSSSETYMP